MTTSAKSKTAGKPAAAKGAVKSEQKKPAATKPAAKLAAKPAAKPAAKSVPAKPASAKPAPKAIAAKPAAKSAPPKPAAKPAIKSAPAKPTAAKAAPPKPASKAAAVKAAPAKAATKPEQKKPAPPKSSKQDKPVKVQPDVNKHPAPREARAAKPATPAAAKADAKTKPIAPSVPAAAKPKATPEPAPGAVDAANAQRSKSKMLPRDFMLELANAIRSAVAPWAREARGREIVGHAASGDPTFEVDRIAEKALLAFLKSARIPVAYYSESAGYTTFTNTQPVNLLIVDPIDGTRAAKNGFEGCVVAIASTRVIERPCMADVDNACVMEILGNRLFYAERGKGVKIAQGNHIKRFKPIKNQPLEMVSWSMTVPGRPAELIFPTAAKLIDLTSLKGGFFPCNSTSFSLTRLVSNQLDACIDVANRYYRDVPYLVKDQFINAGRGAVLGIEPYDIAASLLIAEEAGCIVTDAYGKKFDEVLLLDTSVENQRSMIAAADPALHEKLVTFFDARIRQFEEVLRRRAERQNMPGAAVKA